MTHTTEKLEAMLAAATPGPWRKSPQDGACVTSARGYIGHFSVNRNIKADTRLIAAAPTITAELIAARRKLDAVQGLVETVEAYKSASKSEMVIPADRGGQWGPKGSAIAKTLERKGEMFAALAAWEVAQ